MSFRFGSRIAERNADNNNSSSSSIKSSNSNNNTILGAWEVAVAAVPATLSLPGSQAAVLTRSTRPSARHCLQLLPAPKAIVYPLQLM